MMNDAYKYKQQQKTKIKQTAWCSHVTFQVTFSAFMRKILLVKTIYCMVYFLKSIWASNASFWTQNKDKDNHKEGNQAQLTRYRNKNLSQKI